MSETIYIQLLNEGVQVWRPACGLKCADGNYQIESSETYDPIDEEWEFVPGTIVRCELREMSEGSCLVAVEEIKDN